MKNTILLISLFLLASCGEPTSERPDFNADNGDTTRDSSDIDNSRLTATCSVVSNNGSFTKSVNYSNPSITKVIESSFGESKLLLEEYIINLNELTLTLKAYFISKDDRTVISTNIEKKIISLNDKKIIRYSYNDEKSFDILIDCSTNQPIEVSAKLQ